MSIGSKNHRLQNKVTKYQSDKVPESLSRAYIFIRCYFITLVICNFGTL